MKLNIKRWTIAMTATLALVSCGDFLEESSQDSIKPTTVDDLAAVLYSDAYPYYSYNTDAYLLLLTDEVQCNGATYDNYKERLRLGQPVFCFNNQMFDGYESFISDENSWKNNYKQIMGCNVILDNAYEMIGSDEEKKNLAGQARLLRAFYYLRLVTIYCQPYRLSPETNLGLCLIETSEVKDVAPARASLKETYDFIEKDLIEAAKELDGFVPTTVFRVSKTAAYMLLSRLYLYEENWDKAIEAATMAIKEGPSLTNFNVLSSTVYNVFDYEGSSEVVWNYMGMLHRSTYIGTNYTYSNKEIPYTLPTKVKMLYDADNDLRSKLYVLRSYVTKVSTSSQYNGEHGLRMAEVYLNRAEAYARKYVKGDNAALNLALADLNKLRENRYKTGTYTPLDNSVSSDLLQTVLDERQRELVWEDGHRWMDIKRLGLSVEHIFVDEEGGNTMHILKSDDPLYALPIPEDAISRNPNLKQNPR